MNERVSKRVREIPKNSISHSTFSPLYANISHNAPPTPANNEYATAMPPLPPPGPIIAIPLDESAAIFVVVAPCTFSSATTFESATGDAVVGTGTVGTSVVGTGTVGLSVGLLVGLPEGVSVGCTVGLSVGKGVEGVELGDVVCVGINDGVFTGAAEMVGLEEGLVVMEGV